MAASDYVKGMVIGGLMGAALGILFAPKSGKDTWMDVTKATEDLYGKTKQQYDRTRAKLEEMASCGKSSYAETKERLKEAVEAGVDVFKKEAAKNLEV